MAIGIDRVVHKKLIESLLQFSMGNEKVSHWKDILDDLKSAYEEANEMIRLAELSAERYKEVQAAVRVMVANEWRIRKRKGRIKRIPKSKVTLK